MLIIYGTNLKKRLWLSWASK